MYSTMEIPKCSSTIVCRPPTAPPRSCCTSENGAFTQKSTCPSRPSSLVVFFCKCQTAQQLRKQALWAAWQCVVLKRCCWAHRSRCLQDWQPAAHLRHSCSCPPTSGGPPGLPLRIKRVYAVYLHVPFHEPGRMHAVASHDPSLGGIGPPIPGRGT